ncbi:MAG TPA: tail fiber domain-containing protein [Phycisphaerae bacterium]|nr:tail fiber domain-containing protein [Phycisphaerae bacterium]
MGDAPTVNRQPARKIGRRTRFASQYQKDRNTLLKNRLAGYFAPSDSDPRKSFGDTDEGGAYPWSHSRYGYWKDAYDSAFQDIYGGTLGYREGLSDLFDETRGNLDTNQIQDQWREYLGRAQGYYGTGLDEAEGYLNGGVNDAIAQFRADYDQLYDPDIHRQWLDVASGGAGAVENFWDQSEYNRYLTDLGTEGFNRQANLGGRTYNPYEVQDFIKNTNAEEMWKAFQGLQTAGMAQQDLGTARAQGTANMSMQQQMALAALQQWFAENMNTVDAYGTGQITDLMNQQNQQMYQHDLTGGLSDLELQYMLEAALPAQMTMDTAKQQIASRDMTNLLKIASANQRGQWDWFLNASLPNAEDSWNFQADTVDQAAKGIMSGGMLSAAGGLLGGLSDRRLKENIDKVGELYDGTPIYRFTYLGSPQYQIGVMADEVTPDAVTEFNGVKFVDYRKATEEAVNAAR